MALENNPDFNRAKSRINSFNTVKQTIDNESLFKRAQNGNTDDLSKSESLKSLNSIGDIKQRAQQQFRTVFDDLVELFKSVMPQNPAEGSTTIDFLITQVLTASQNTKGRINEIITEEVMKTAGCSEEQTFDPSKKLYIDLRNVDLTELLKNSPNDSPWDLKYEKDAPQNGSFPFSMNKSLHELTQNPNQNFSSLYGNTLIGQTGQGIMDLKYVSQYTENGVTFYGDYLEVDLSNRFKGNNLGDFLMDYYKSIEILDFDMISVEVQNQLTNFFDISAGITSSEKEVQSRFSKIIQRILGLCFDSTREIDVQGTAKLGQLDHLDQSFFEMSSVDLKNIEKELNNVKEGVTEFVDCGNIKFPINTEKVIKEIRNLRDIPSNNPKEKVKKLKESVKNLSNDDNWRLQIPDSLTLNVAINNDFIKIIPNAILMSIISPKMLLGLMITLRSINPSYYLTLQIENLEDFVNEFKKFTVEVMSKISEIFIEELFELIKKNIRILVETLLIEITKESKDARLKIISSLIFLLIQTISAVIDYRQCKSLVDEIMKLLSLADAFGGGSIPSFLLAAASLSPGYSPTRAMAGITEKLQSIGLPTGDLPSGAPNIAMQAIFQQLKGNYDEQVTNGVVETFVRPVVVAPLVGGLSSPTSAVGKFY